MLFDNPLFAGWYTDTMDIYRAENKEYGGLTRQEAVKQNQKPLPCRVYQSGKSAPSMGNPAGSVSGIDKLACDLSVDIRKGDELLVVRGGNLGIQTEPERYFAGGKQDFYDPVGGAMSGLQHKEITLLTDEING